MYIVLHKNEYVNPLAGGQHISVPAASSVTLAQLREPEPSPLPAVGDADDAAGGPGEPDGNGSPLAAGGRGHALAGLPAPETRPPTGDGGQEDDAGFGDALTAALRRHFQVCSSSLHACVHCMGDTGITSTRVLADCECICSPVPKA